jgi:hypothetical protein
VLLKTCYWQSVESRKRVLNTIDSMAASATLTVDSSTIQNVVKMKGLPFKATSDDVIKFFQGFTLLSEQIYLKRHPDGRPNGEVLAPLAFWVPHLFYMRATWHAELVLFALVLLNRLVRRATGCIRTRLNEWP